MPLTHTWFLCCYHTAMLLLTSMKLQLFNTEPCTCPAQSWSLASEYGLVPTQLFGNQVDSYFWGKSANTSLSTLNWCKMIKVNPGLLLALIPSPWRRWQRTGCWQSCLWDKNINSCAAGIAARSVRHCCTYTGLVYAVEDFISSPQFHAQARAAGGLYFSGFRRRSSDTTWWEEQLSQLSGTGACWHPTSGMLWGVCEGITRTHRTAR